MTEEAHSSLLHRARLKALFKRAIVIILIFMVAYSAIALLYASQTIYKVRLNYAVILETLSGQRIAVTEVGWHTRPLSPNLNWKFR